MSNHLVGRRVMIFGLISALLFSGAPMALPAGTTPPTPERSAELFRITAQELETDGDLYLHLNVENLLADFVDLVTKFVGTIGSESDRAQARDTAQRVQDFLQQEGLFDGVALGISSKPRGDGTHSVRTFLARRPVEPTPPFWRMLGGEPRELAALRVLPPDTAAASVTDFRLDELWAMIQRGIRSIGGEDAFKKLRGEIDELKTSKGIDLDAALASHTGELAVAVVLSRTEQATLPIGKGLEIPAPSLLVGIGVRGDAAMKAILKLIEDMPVEVEDFGGAKIHKGPVAPDAPFLVQICGAQSGGLLLVASRVDTLKAALEAAQTGGGLIADPEFRRLADRLPQKNNGITYVTERFNRALISVQRAQMAGAHGADSPPELMLQMIYDWLPSGTAISARVVKPYGIYQQTEGPSGARELVASLAVIPLSMVLGISAPAMIEARANAEEARLVQVLRMADIAKEQWAIEHNKSDGSEPTLDDLAPYLPPDGLKLPEGHQLILKPIGHSPQIIRPNGEVVELP